MVYMVVPMLMSATIQLARANAASRRTELEAQTKRDEIYANLEVARIEAERADRDHARQQQVLLQMIDAAENFQTMKLDALTSAFSQTTEIVRQQQSALIEEKRAISAGAFQAGITAERQLVLRQRQNEIDRELRHITTEMKIITAEFMHLVTELQPSLPQSQLLSIEEMVSL